MLRRVAKELRARVRVVLEVEEPGPAVALGEGTMPYRTRRRGAKPA